MKIFVVGGATYYASIFKNFQITRELEEADLVFFTGGADVDPKLYGEEKHMTTTFLRYRDDQEQSVFEEALKLNKKMIGVCRGSQFLTVMSGGKLIQHVDNHAIAGTHTIKNY